MSRSAVNKAPHLVRRTAIVGFLAIIVACGVTAVADTFLASRAEQRLSVALTAAPGVGFRPEVTLGGFPFLSHARSGEFTGATITARGVTAPGCQYTPVAADGGHDGCFAELGATLGPLTVPDAFDITADQAIRTQSITAYASLNSVNLGRFLGILDLTVNTPAGADRVGGGGPQFGNIERTDGVVLTGTVALPPTTAPSTDGVPTPTNSPAASEYPGPTTRVSVSVDLSVRDGRLHIAARSFYTGPENHVTSAIVTGDDADLVDGMRFDRLRQAILDRFTTTLPPIPMPWGLRATGAHSAGSDIRLTASSGPVDVQPRRFATF